jgi:hypothetical protein
MANRPFGRRTTSQPVEERRMAASLFTCPTTCLNVQHWLDDDENIAGNEYEWVVCRACSRLHLVNRKTGLLVGQAGAEA